MEFISEDKKTITLPIPLGSILYRFVTSCNDSCMFQKEDFDRVFPKESNSRCSKDMPCHTKLHSIQTVEVKLSNLELILENWHITIFESENKAKEAGNTLIDSHKQQLLNLGLKVE